MIRPCTDEDLASIESIINEAAAKYRGAIPDDCWHEPYMTRSALQEAIDEGVRFWAWQEEGELVGVMALQDVDDVTLIRHAYVRTRYQGRGIGGALLKDLAGKTSRPLLIGTWADAHWAIRFYEQHGFHVVDAAEADRLLKKYWKIPARQRETSVVLAQVAG